ncbi:protein GRAVITROPIC IN THE LIGHT 1-like [Zingiber officinale]|uniref:DUF641 domain-containing protein n=1 Tax=Zingiber officinale TaxID=94328 RepID=A0A8J5HNC0_ZINOF|nr:protein GRAVITROPIC IN THE LIGHT 1-like [Zingiber officinale]XP_042469340.1 protein GRAVITROPIC IN THE LIGHT 1-like [Zingiber officinale]KAG6531547.1 hypothetical protein ZIOFF_005361 [Zingiber officinale]
MEYTQRAPQPKLGTLARAFNKILRLRRSFTSSASDAPSEDSCSVHKLKLSQTFSDFPTIISEGGSDFYKVEYEKPRQKFSSKDRQTTESLLAHLFASISAIKAAYAQLQMAQLPYQPNLIQSSDLTIVSEFRRVSELKHSYFRDQLAIPRTVSDSSSDLVAQIEEQWNLIKAYPITKAKLESDLELKDSEILSLQAKLLESKKRNQILDSNLHPGRSLSPLDGLHPSGLTPNHFLTALRFAINSIRSFVKELVKQMESARWDLDAAASAIQPGVLRRGRTHRSLAFQSYICQQIFSDFHHKSYNLDGLEDRTMWCQRRFFDEFIELRHIVPLQKLWQHPAAAKFLRAKFLSLVHPKMESSFFGNLNHRDAVSSGRCFPNTAFFTGFAEMAMRVWFLHCIFFSFEDSSIFQARKGSRFSEVYMESVWEVNEDDDHVTSAAADEHASTAVGFTVVPGFRVGQTVVQCQVYLA